MIATTETTWSTVLNVNDTIYAFSGLTGQVVLGGGSGQMSPQQFVLDVTNGDTTVVTYVDPDGVIAGATRARPAAVH